MLFGVGGMQRFYSMGRYEAQHVPAYLWVEEATIGLENAESMADGWGKKAAMAYRQPLYRASHGDAQTVWNVVTAASLTKALCGARPSGGPVLYSLRGTHAFATPADAIEYDALDHCGGASMLGPTEARLTRRPDTLPGPPAPSRSSRR